MDHDSATKLLSEFVNGELDAASAAAVQSHVDDCPDCRGTARFMQRVGEVAASAGTSLLDEHPGAQELASYALDPQSIPMPALAELAVHARACPTCRVEVELARRAGAASQSWWRRIVSALTHGPATGRWAMAAGAGAILVVCLIYPSYLGLVSLPRSQDEGRRLALQLAQGGGVRLLYLTDQVRGASAQVPEILRDPHQLFQLLVAECDLAGEGLSSPVTPVAILVRRLPDETVTWRLESSWAEVWDASLGLVSVLVPSRRLEPGDYRLEIFTQDAAAPVFASRFRIAPAPR